MAAEEAAAQAARTGDSEAWTALAEAREEIGDDACAEHAAAEAARAGDLDAWITPARARENAGDSSGAELAANLAAERGAPDTWSALSRTACQPGAGAAVPLGQARHLLDECLAGTTLPVTEVPADPQPDDDPARCQRPFIQSALVLAVYAAGLFSAVRAQARPGGGHRLHDKDVGEIAEALHAHIDPGKQHSLDRLARHAGTYSAETILRPLH